MQKALIISYSQAGQTQRAIETFSRGLEDNLKCDWVKFEPLEQFKFPWSIRNFFRVFPRSVGRVAPPIKPLDVNWDDYDLVIIGYQVWFLSPSLPIQGFLQSPDAQRLRGKKVITLITCRNLWRSASAFFGGQLDRLGALHLGIITLCEISPLWASFVTTPRWMLTGKKSAFLFFPPAGISDQEFEKLEEKGRRAGAIWQSHGTITPDIFGSNLNRVSLDLMDAIGYRAFRIWSRIILTVAPQEGLWQDFWLLLFRINLIILIVCVGPCTRVYEIVHNNFARELNSSRGE